MKRRNFIQSSVTAGAGLLILPGYMQSIKGANDRLNIALIGAHGRASQLYHHINTENIVAICDVHADKMSLATAEFPGAKRYTDWRKCLEQKDIDAVFICTPDHHHAFINIWAMNRGLHVFCEKPLADSVEEAREVRKTYLANRNKLATQHGTQRHAHENFARVSELVRNGAIGELKVVQAWGSRTHNEKGYRPSEGPPPPTIDWEQWIGPVRMHPYNSGYFSAERPGSNCLNWNMFLDFGAWQIGDMGAHTMDLAWQAIDADLPITIEATGDSWNPEVAPSDHHATFTFPATNWRGEITLEWFQGTLKPEIPHSALDITRIGHGVMFRGTKGTLIADFTSRILIPDREGADMTYYNAPDKNMVAPEFGNFWAQWINACKGDPMKTTCNFDYAGRMIETLYLGLAAHQSGKKLHYDSSEGRVTNDPIANDFLRKEYRSGWVLNG